MQFFLMDARVKPAHDGGRVAIEQIDTALKRVSSLRAQRSNPTLCA
jgi:hypothetical protein